MGKRVPKWILACIGVLLVLSWPTDVRAAGVSVAGGARLSASLGISVRHDSNIYRSQAETNAMITTVTPILEFVTRTSPNRYSITYSGQAGFYKGIGDRPENADDNYIDHKLKANARIRLGAKGRLGLTAAYTLAHEDRGTGFSEGVSTSIVTAPIEYNSTRLEVTLAIGRASSTVRVEGAIKTRTKAYQNFLNLTAQGDQSTTRYEGALYLRAKPGTTLLIQVSSEEVAYDSLPVIGGSLDNSSLEYLAGVIFKKSSRSSITITGGGIDKSFTDPARKNFSSAKWEGVLSWSPRSYSVLRLSTRRVSEATNGAADFIDSQNIAIDWDHEWGPLTDTRIRYSIESRSYEGTSRSDDISKASASWDYWVLSCLTAGVELVHESRDSTDATYDYERSLVMFNMRGQLCPGFTSGEGRGERWPW